MTDDERLADVLAQHTASACNCGHAIGWGDIAWNNSSTEAGTDCCTVEIQCEACQREIAHFFSWYPHIEDNTDLVHVLETDWRF